MASVPRIATSVAQLKDALRDLGARSRRVGLVPTMGALHEGHLSLVRAASTECETVVATIFVNPTQFAPHEDLAKYPRTLDADLELLAQENTDLVFLPTNAEVYPEGFSTYVEPSQVAVPLEGTFRPNHFRGVATVVLKLFNMVQPDVAYFGQKDFQQCLVVRRMIADLNLPIEFRVCPIVREPDGLAISSRNRYLTPAERTRALAISRSLTIATELIRQGERSAAVIKAKIEQVMRDAGIDRIDYVAVADPDTLMENQAISRPVILLIAAFVGQTRLIDNCLVE
jgi:pantoate--beta-alanine ligase